METAVAQRRRHRRLPLQPIAESALLDHRDGPPIRAEEVVIELLEPHARLDLEAGGEPTRQRLTLDDGDRVAALRQAERDGQAEGAGAEYRRRRARYHRHVSLRHGSID